MKLLIALTLMVALAACQHTKDEPADTGLAGYDPHMIENQQQDCAARGGRFGQGGLSGSFVCYEDTEEGSKSCSSSNDCTGFCLARSKTCAPIKPLFGCNDVLGSSGAASTICLD